MLKKYRLKRGYTLEKLAEECEISWRNLQRIESGRYGNAKFETIQKLVNKLDIDDKDILKLVKEKKRAKSDELIKS